MTAQPVPAASASSPNQPQPRAGFLFPWYALLLVGLLLTGFMSWMLVLRAAWQRGLRRQAWTWLAVNVALGTGVYFACLRAPVVWWQVDAAGMAFNLAWAAGAWLFQRRLLGEANHLIDVTRRRELGAPLLASAVLGFGVAVTMSLPDVMNEERELLNSMDILDRSSILWMLLRRGFAGIPYGLFAGVWWWASGERFRPSMVVSSLAGCGISLLFIHVLVLALNFYVHSGDVAGVGAYANWSCLLPWMSGPGRSFLGVQDVLGVLSQLVLGLLFCTSRGVRDFWSRTSVPTIAFACWLPFLYGDTSFNQLTQDQMVYDFSSQSAGRQDAAHRRVEAFLYRYPQHRAWAMLASSHAGHLYDRGRHAEARQWWQRIVDRYGNSKRQFWYVDYARAALGSSAFGTSADTLRIDMPMVDYESYFDDGWMTLVTLMHYWEHDSIAESRTKLKLRKLSRSDEGIELKKISSLIDIDDAARSLGYEVFIVPASTAALKSLLDSRIPVLYPAFFAMSISYGYDLGRSTLFTYRFSNLSSRLKQKARKETDVILSARKEGEGRGRERLERIANEGRTDMNWAMADSPAGRYSEPLAVVVCPARAVERVSGALGMAVDSLTRMSNGFRAALIALEYVERSDPRSAVQWAATAASLVHDPLCYHAGYLGWLQWRSRDRKPLSSLQLGSQLPELGAYASFFESTVTKRFLDTCSIRFITDRDAGRLPQVITYRYIPLLEVSSGSERASGLQVARRELGLIPTNMVRWKWVLRAVSWEESPDARLEVYREYVSVNPYDYGAKVRLAKELVDAARFEGADSILGCTVADSVRTDADYHFCLARIAEKRGQAERAMQLYERCTRMRHYKPEYFEAHAGLLRARGRSEEADRAAAWARRLSVKDIGRPGAESTERN